MFKETVYDKIVEVLNLNSQGLKFASGYDLVYYVAGVPTAVFTSTESKFDYSVQSVIPVSEEYNQETPSVNDSDRSDYVCGYQIMFKLSQLSKVKIALEEYRAYFVANRYIELDGYNVTFKVTRGEKQGTYNMGAGNLQSTYKLTVYLTATKGYIKKPIDKWEIRNATEDTAFVDLPTLEETCVYLGNTNPSLASQLTKFKVTSYVLNKKFSIYYDSSTFASELYELITTGGISDTYEVRETFNGVVQPTQEVIVVGASRLMKPNAPVILSFDLLRKYNE